MGVLAITLRARERFAAVNHEAFFSFISTARVCSASVLLGRPGSTNYDILLGDLDVPSMVRIPSRYQYAELAELMVRGVIMPYTQFRQLRRVILAILAAAAGAATTK